VQWRRVWIFSWISLAEVARVAVSDAGDPDIYFLWRGRHVELELMRRPGRWLRWHSVGELEAILVRIDSVIEAPATRLSPSPMATGLDAVEDRFERS
jgi:hypothetical protein